MRWSLLTLSLLLVLLDASHGSAQSPASEAALATALREILATRVPQGARVGLAVVVADTGRPLFVADADLALNPASNAKLLTTAAALGILGGATTFSTAVIGSVNGDAAESLTLLGGGDPSLRARDLDALAAQLAARGIRRVPTGVVISDGLYGGEQLPPGFEQQPDEAAGFRPMVSALAVEGAAFSVSLVGRAPGGACDAWVVPPEAAALEGGAVTAATGAPLLRVDATADGRALVNLGGQCVPGLTTYRRRQLHPTRVAGDVFVSALRRYGVRVDDAPRILGGSERVVAPGAPSDPRGSTLAEHRSASLAILLHEAGKESNNFTAEMLLLALAPPASRTPAAAATRALGWLRERGVPTGAMVMRNGSGLYDSNRVSARQLTEVLRVPWRDAGLRHDYVSHLAIAGEDGTLRHRFANSPARGVVRAKTGTLDDVVALSGYVLAANASRTLVFSVIVNGCRGRTTEARRLVDDVAIALARHVRAGR